MCSQKTCDPGTHRYPAAVSVSKSMLIIWAGLWRAEQGLRLTRAFRWHRRCLLPGWTPAQGKGVLLSAGCWLPWACPRLLRKGAASWDLENFLPIRSCHLRTEKSFTSSFPICMTFSCLTALARPFRDMLNRSGQSRLPRFVPDLRGKAFSVSKLTVESTVVFHRWSLSC